MIIDKKTSENSLFAQDESHKHSVTQQKILLEINEIEPTGTYLKYTDIYDQISEERYKIINQNDIENHIPANNMESNKNLHWKKIKNICIDILINKSKDLQIFMWLLEAEAFLNTIYNLQDYLNIFHKFIDKFWLNMHPKGTKVFLFEWLDKHISIALTKIKITDNRDFNNEIILFDLINAKKFNNIEKINQIQSHIKNNNLNFYENIQKYANKTLQKIKEINDFLKQKEDNIQFISIENTLNDLIKFAQQIIYEKNNQHHETLTSHHKLDGELISDNSVNIEENTPQIPFNIEHNITEIINQHLQNNHTTLENAILKQYLYWHGKNILDLISEYQLNPTEMIGVLRFLGLLDSPLWNNQKTGDTHIHTQNQNLSNLYTDRAENIPDYYFASTTPEELKKMQKSMDNKVANLYKNRFNKSDNYVENQAEYDINTDKNYY